MTGGHFGVRPRFLNLFRFGTLRSGIGIERSILIARLGTYRHLGQYTARQFDQREKLFEKTFQIVRQLFIVESRKGAMNSQEFAFGTVMNETRLLKLIHEKANARPRGPHHFCQRFMIDLRDRGFRCSMTIKVGEHKENPGQPSLTEITAVVN
jgi:hypothetical protein